MYLLIVCTVIYFVREIRILKYKNELLQKQINLIEDGFDTQLNSIWKKLGE